MPGPFPEPGVWQARALWPRTKTFERELRTRAEGTSEFTVDAVNILLLQLGEALSPDVVPELCHMEATAHLDDAEGLTLRVTVFGRPHT
jgi:hypothetical protein